jgi:hypothetical protein
MKTIIYSLLSILVLATIAAYDGWSDPIRFVDGEFPVDMYREPFAALDQDGNYVVVSSHLDTDYDIYFTKIDQTGNVLVEPTPIGATSNEEYSPVCVLASDNTVHVFYIRSEGYHNVYHVHVNNDGTILDPPYRFVLTYLTSPGTRVLPSIVKEPDDTIHIAYKIKIGLSSYLGYTRYNLQTEDRLDINGFYVEHPKITYQNLNDHWDIDVDSEGNAHLFFDQSLEFEWANPITDEVCWAKVPYDSEGEYESRIISDFYDDGLRDDRSINATIDDTDLIHMMWGGVIDGGRHVIYSSMDIDGNEVTEKKRCFPDEWEEVLHEYIFEYNNDNIAMILSTESPYRFAFGRFDLNGNLIDDIAYITDEWAGWYEDFCLIHHNNGFVGFFWHNDEDLWYQYTLDGFTADDPNLSAFPNDEGILLSWQEEGDLTGSTWRLERDGERLVNLSGDALYRYLDRDAEPNVTHLYTLEATLPDGSVRRFGPVEAAWPGSDADRLTLYAAFPCPATDQVTLAYYLPENVKNAELSLYDLSGRLVESSASVPITPGRHEIAYDTSVLPSGVYVVRLAADAGALTRWLVIAR